MKSIYLVPFLLLISQASFAMSCEQMQEPMQTICRQNELILSKLEDMEGGGSRAYLCTAYCSDPMYVGREMKASGSKQRVAREFERQCAEDRAKERGNPKIVVHDVTCKEI